jgi:hypothetical protein
MTAAASPPDKWLSDLTGAEMALREVIEEILDKWPATLP